MIFSDFLISFTRDIKYKIRLINFKIFNKILIILKYMFSSLGLFTVLKRIDV